MSNVVLTCVNSRDINFLLNHWLKSLQEQVDLQDIDIAVFLYDGITSDQTKLLTDSGVIAIQGNPKGHINCVRFSDYKGFLESNPKYDQVLAVDGGDIIFQSDINHLFREHRNKFRAVIENYYPPHKRLFLTTNFFSKEDIKEMRTVLHKKPMINAGVIFAPKDKFIRLCNEIERLLSNKKHYGPDQQVINYLLYREQFIDLPEKYNFIPLSAQNSFCIHNGVFYLKNKEKIPIVHNPGGKDPFRRIKNFGYGQNRNEIKLGFEAFRLFNKVSTKFFK